MQLMRIKKREPLGQSSLGDLVVPSLSQTNRIHMDLRISKPQHSVALFIDGAMIKQWIDPNGFAGEGKGVRFVQNPPGGAVKISNLMVSQWDGVLEEGRPADIDLSRDTAWLSDGSILSGTVEAINAGKMMFQSKNNTVEIPLARLRNLEFAQPRGPALALRPQAGTPTATTNQWQPVPSSSRFSAAAPGNTRASFAQGGAVNFKLENWSPEAVTVHSPAFGKAKFNPVAFVRFQFLEAQADTKPSPGVE